MVRENNRKQYQPPRLVGLFIAFFLLQALALWGTEEISLELDPPKVVRGNNVVIRIKTSLPWGDDIRINRPLITGSMVWWSYPYARPWRFQNEDGEFVRAVEVLSALRVDGAGFHSLDPFHISVGNREVSTDIVKIVAVNADERDFPYPVSVKWHSIPQTVWQGQVIPITLYAQNLPFLTLADSAVMDQVPAGMLKNAPGLGKIITRTYGNDIIYDVPMDSWLWILGESGTFTFPGVQVSVNGLKRTIKGFSVDVKSLPEEVHVSGAVGRFLLDAEWDREKQYRKGDIISLRLRIIGEGNINILRLPLPILDNAELVSSSSTSSYLPSAFGYEGWREERSEFRLTQSGLLKINIPEWKYFNPEGSGVIHRIREQNFDLQIENTSEENTFSSAEMLLGAELFHYRATIFHGGNIHWYYLLLPGFLFLITTFLLQKYKVHFLWFSMLVFLSISAKDIDVVSIEKAVTAKEYALKGKWNDAYEIYNELDEQYGELPGLLHERALVAMELEKIDVAVTLLNRSLYLRPSSKKLTQTLEFVEDRFGLMNQRSPSLSWSPSLIFVLWLLGVNGILCSIAFLLYQRKIRDVLLFISIFIFVVLSSTMLVYTHVSWGNQIGVVKSESQALRKIPSVLASEWIKLPPGSTVSVKAVEGRDCLVLTGYGLEGWITRDSLNLVKGGSYEGF